MHKFNLRVDNEFLKTYRRRYKILSGKNHHNGSAATPGLVARITPGLKTLQGLGSAAAVGLEQTNPEFQLFSKGLSELWHFPIFRKS
jgi:hypothetical protein